jgi:hypothetical protein
MKKVLIILASLCLVAVVLAIAGVAFVVSKGRAFDRESKAYVDSAVPAIVSGWDKQQLLSRASPEFRQAVTDEDLEKLYNMFRRLGTLKSYDGSQGESNMSVTNRGKVISASYLARATFDTGPAEIKIALIKHDEWQIMGFRIDSKVFLER